jgi:beta-galactosidase/beta-glucuronidase
VVYNVRAEGLSPEERAELYDTDFRLLRETGANTILCLGDTDEFDELTLSKAAEYGLGVILPFVLDPHADYSDPEYQWQIREAVANWLQRYRNHSAVRMWGIGKEILANLRPQEGEAFARFYLTLADMVHEIDPNHPILYQGSEVFAAQPLAKLLKRDGRQRPWLVYGINSYTMRLAQVLQEWPTLGWDGPVLVSSFGPLGLYPADRPVGYSKMWKAIRAHQEYTLGGLAYVWTTDGIDPMDQAFGLYEADRQPADGSIYALSAAWKGQIVASEYRKVPLHMGGAPPSPDLPLVFERLLPPSQVKVEGRGYHYQYIVNGRPEKIKGIGYNAMYRHLSDAERAALYERDFQAIRQTGANTIIGWGEQHQFDELTLLKAQQHGLGVVMPYYLDPLGDYADPEYRAAVRADVASWVQRFKSSPALRIWGLGNEVIHLLGDDEARQFAKFYVELADLVHELDPNHPVAYRAAEDVAILPLAEVFKQSNQPRPWFILGMNVFTFRIEQAIAEWPELNWDVALFFSEFGPLGLLPDERPAGFLRMWQAIEDEPDRVLGGFVYTWTTAGPERVDVAFGLVDDAGQPVDDLLAAVTEAFHR